MEVLKEILRGRGGEGPGGWRGDRGRPHHHGPRAQVRHGGAGLAHEHAIVTNAGARFGDALVLTKALGTGVLTTAGKSDRLGPAALEEAVAQMKELNRGACEAMVPVGVNGCTDVTGFGLLGHLRG